MERGNLLNPAMSLLCKRFWPWRHASFPSDPAEFSHCSADHFLCFCRGNFCWQIDQSLLQEAAIVLWKNPQEWWELFTVCWSWKAKAFSGNPPGKYPRCSSARWVWGLAERGSESKATCTVKQENEKNNRDLLLISAGIYSKIWASLCWIQFAQWSSLFMFLSEIWKCFLIKSWSNKDKSKFTYGILEWI